MSTLPRLPATPAAAPRVRTRRPLASYPPVAVAPLPRASRRPDHGWTLLLAVVASGTVALTLGLTAWSRGGLPAGFCAGYGLLAVLTGVLTGRPEPWEAPDTSGPRRLLARGSVLVAAGALLATAVGADLTPSELLVLGAAPAAAAAATEALATTRALAARVVVVGHRSGVAALLGELARTTRPRFRVAAACVPREGRGLPHGVARIVGFDRIGDAVREHRADAVIVVPCRHFDAARLRRLRWELEATGATLLVASTLNDVASTRTAVRYAGSLPLLRVRPAQLDGFAWWVKIVAERAVASIALLVLAPLLIVLAAQVRRDSPGPALFRQVRIGRDGVPFLMLKLRTMTVDAEARRADLLPLGGTDVLFKIKQDPRVTRFGAVLRRYSLDELPQLLHVVRGEMSLVGPRPALPDEVGRYDDDTRRRLAVRPGITGLWQVSGRSDLAWAEAVRLDLRYVDNWSLGSDLRILGRTIGAVLRHRGAY